VIRQLQSYWILIARTTHIYKIYLKLQL